MKRVTVKGVDKRYRENVYGYVQNDIRPNSWLNLTLYNLFNTKNGKYKVNRIKNIGEAPHILDSSLVAISKNQIEKYLHTKGFFNASVDTNIKIRNKKAYITFIADRGPMFRVRNYTYEIPDTALRNLYERNRDAFSRIKSGKRYDRDSVMNEINGIYTLMKQNGYYDFQRQNIHVEVDSALQSAQADLKLTVANPTNGEKHTVYTIGDTYTVVRKNNGSVVENPDTAHIDSQYFFKDHTGKIRPKALYRYIFFKSGDVYNVNNENLTYDRLYDLNIFKSIKIDYVKNADSNRLDPRIEAIPLKKMSNRIEGEYTFNSGRNGFNIGNTYTNRNFLGGAEQLEIKLRYGTLFNRGSVFAGIYNRDFQIGANLILPQLLVPFYKSKLGTAGLPRTTFSTSFQMFDQLQAFSNRSLINSVTYDWYETPTKQHSVTPFNIEYRDGRFDQGFKNYLLDSGYVFYVRTNDRQYFNLSSQYNFTYNNVKLTSYDNFFYFRGGLDIAGNTLGLLSTTFSSKRDSTGVRTFAKLPYLQYAKGEIDFRIYRSLGQERVFVARINPGVGMPYGNSRFLPFEKNFFAGGSSGVRAWQARTLGPGVYNRSVLDTTARRNLRNLDQLGEIKLEANLEYRFKILNNFFGAKLRGAAFSDFGNVWRVRPVSDNPGGEFKWSKFLSQLAIGVGGGLRYDVEYFVFRLDAGIKVKDPQFNDPWVIKHFFDKKDFRRQFEQTHFPDIYRFVQYNFGIGMPF